MANIDGPESQLGGEVQELPPGVKLLHTLEGHQAAVTSVAFDPQGVMLASGSVDNMVKLWDLRSGKLVRTLFGHQDVVFSVAFDPQVKILASGSADDTVKLWSIHFGTFLGTLRGHRGTVHTVMFDLQGRSLASGSADTTVRLWEARTGKLISTLKGHQGSINSVAFDLQGLVLASGSYDKTVKVWDPRSGSLYHTLKGHEERVMSVAFDPRGGTLTSASADGSLKIWQPLSGKLLRTLEGHTDILHSVAYSPDGRLLASKSCDQTIRLWNCETWETVAVIPEPTNHERVSALAFHPTLPLLSSAGSEPGTPDEKRSRLIHLWELDYSALLRRRSEAIHHTTGKIVLVGDSGVGKTGLGWRLAHSEYKEHSSTHGQQFWVIDALCKQRDDGTQCEAVLWDLAGQPDYRLIHSLFLDDADLALVLFDPTDTRDPLHGVEFWLKQLRVKHDSQFSDSGKTAGGSESCPTVLVAARCDRGTATLTREELEAFCRQRGILGYFDTSAKAGAGVAELIEKMKSIIPWDDKAATITTATFKRIKDYVLSLKEEKADRKIIVIPDELRSHLEATDAEWQFTDAEMMTAVGHLENYGYVKRLRTSNGEMRILLQPERLNNLASSFVLEARRHQKGLGALEENRLLSGGYQFPELEDLSESERDVLLDSAALLFLEHNVCFREADPLNMVPYLVFPELINLKRPLEEDAPTEDSVAYTISGPTENVFASLVVLLGYTHTFTRTAQWHNNARYEVGDALVCGFRQETERDGELNFVLCFGPEVGAPVKTLFQGLFESFLARKNLTVLRYEPVRCSRRECGHPLDRSIVRQRLKDGKAFAFCNDCGEKLMLPAMAEPIQLTQEVRTKVDTQRRAAEQRTRFEQAVFRVQAYTTEQGITPPECFISYAWGVQEHERWVEKRLATDLQKAGIAVLLDRWDNTPGSSIQRFVDRLEKADRIVVVGTKLYRQKYDNLDPTKGTVVAAECAQIACRMRGPEEKKKTVVPVLLEGGAQDSLPPCLHDQVFCSFHDDIRYFITAFDLILSLYQIKPNNPAVSDLLESLRELEMR